MANAIRAHEEAADKAEDARQEGVPRAVRASQKQAFGSGAVLENYCGHCNPRRRAFVAEADPLTLHAKQPVRDRSSAQLI